MTEREKRILRRVQKRRAAPGYSVAIVAMYLGDAHRGRSSYDGRSGNVDSKTGTPLFDMKSNPGFQRCGSERGTPVRSGKSGGLKLQRPNPAAGEERAERETLAERMWRTVEVVDRDPDSPTYGKISEGIVPSTQTGLRAELRAGNHMNRIGSGEILANGVATK